MGLKKLKEKPKVRMDPDTIVQYHLKGRTITRDLKQSIRETLLVQLLKKYYCDKVWLKHHHF